MLTKDIATLIDEKLKQRLVGAAVLVSLAVIFIPMLLDRAGPPQVASDSPLIPPKPDEEFQSRIVPLTDELLSKEGFLPVEQDPGMSVIERASADNAAEMAPRVALEETSTSVTDDAPSDQAPASAIDQSTPGWVVQLASFSRKENAAALEAKLKQSGYKAFVEKLNGRNGVLYRVRVGPESVRAKADELRAALQKAVSLEGVVVGFP